MTIGKREIEQRLSKLEKGRHCSACAPGADNGGDDLDHDAATTVAGDWVAERLVVQADGEPEPSVGGCCARCGREQHVVIVRERVVALASAKSDCEAATPNAAPLKTAGNVKKSVARPAFQAKSGRRKK